MEKEDYEQAVIDYEKIYKLDKSKGKTIFYLNNKLYLTIYFWFSLCLKKTHNYSKKPNSNWKKANEKIITRF